MKKIKLTQGKYTLVDDADFESLSSMKWQATKSHTGMFYARGSKRINGKWKGVSMHRVIMNPPDDMDVDHINRDGLDNRRENLRICTKYQNQLNRGPAKKSKTGIKGVLLLKEGIRRYLADIHINGEYIYLGTFLTKEEAAEVRYAAEIKYHGEFATANALKANKDKKE